MLDRLVSSTRSFLKGLSVEPSCFIFYFAYSVYTIGAQRLVLQKTCSPDQVPRIEDRCDDPFHIGRAADINTVRNVIGEALPGLVIFVAGSWRDATGRSRPLMLLTFLAEFLSSGIFLLSANFWWVPPWPASIVESILGGIGGGKQLLNMAAVCVISNRSSPEDRTFRLTFFIVSIIAGLSLANAVSGYILSALGYTYFFGGIMILYFLAFILAVLCVKEKPSKLEKGGVWLNLSKFKIVFQPRENRAVIWLMIVNSWLVYTTMCGESNVILYFLERAYGFDVKQSGFFLSYLMTMNFLSSVFLSPFLIKILKWSDFTIGLIGSILTITAVIGIAFTKSVTLLCVFAAADVMRYSVLTIQRSIITKCLPDEELGTYWSFVAIGEALMPMMILPVYDLIFKETLAVLPGAHYLASGAIALVAFINICVAKHLYQKMSEGQEKC